MLSFLSPAFSVALPFFSIFAPLAFSASAAFSWALPFFSISLPALPAGLSARAETGAISAKAPASASERIIDIPTDFSILFILSSVMVW